MRSGAMARASDRLIPRASPCASATALRLARRVAPDCSPTMAKPPRWSLLTSRYPSCAVIANKTWLARLITWAIATFGCRWGQAGCATCMTMCWIA